MSMRRMGSHQGLVALAVLLASFVMIPCEATNSSIEQDEGPLSTGAQWLVEEATVTQDTVFSEGWESGMGSWWADGGVWEIGVPTAGPDGAHLGQNCAGTILGDDYPATANSRLISPDIPVVPDSEATVELFFWHWFSIYSNDSSVVEVSMEGGPWQQVAGPYRWDSGGWSQVRVDLSAFANSTIRLGFRFGSYDNWAIGSEDESYGWYVDDISIRVGTPDGFKNPEEFEQGIGDWWADNGVWEVGQATHNNEPDAHSGQNCAGTVLGDDYPATANSRFISPDIPVVPDSEATVELFFWHWFSIYSNDSSVVEVSMEGGPWQQVAGPYRWDSGGWSQVRVDLSAFANSTIRLGFRFGSYDNWAIGSEDESYGWYVDDVRLEGVAVFLPPELGSPPDGSIGRATSVTMSWSPQSWATSYRLQLSENANFAQIKVDSTGMVGSSLSVDGLENYTSYWWRVKSYYGEGDSTGWSEEWTFRTIVGVPTLVSPADSATQVPQDPTLQWRAPEGAASYRVQVATDAGFGQPDVDTTGVVAGTSVEVSRLDGTTQYYWRVKARESNPTNASDWSDVWLFTTIFAPPTPETPDDEASCVSLNPTLTWELSPEADTYGLQVATDSVFENVIIYHNGLTETSYEVNGLSHNTTCYWRVNGTNEDGTTSWSDPWEFTTVLATPELESPDSGDTSIAITPVLSWQPIPGATSYGVQVASDQTFSDVAFDTTGVAQDSVEVPPALLEIDTTYYWWVYAHRDGCDSEWSGVWDFTTIDAAIIVEAPPPPTVCMTECTYEIRWTGINFSGGDVDIHLSVDGGRSYYPLPYLSGVANTGSASWTIGEYTVSDSCRLHIESSSDASIVGKSGLFRIRARPPAVVPMSTTVAFPEEPTLSTDYRLISIPGDVSTTTAGEIATGSQKTDWRMFRDNGAEADYLVELSSGSTLSMGEGYWFLQKDTLSISMYMEMPELDCEDGTYSIPLHSGFNIVANPFDKGVSWSSVVGATGLDSVTMLYDYRGSDGYLSWDVLEPFAGYYFFNLEADTLVIPYPFDDGVGAPAPAPGSPTVDWRLQLVFEGEINTDRCNYIGIAESASDRLDPLDSRKPPLFMDQGFLYFSRPEWDATYPRFSADYRSALEDGQVWEFEVHNPRGGAGKITVNGIEQVPEAYEVKLIDLHNTVPVDLRDNAEYRYETVSEKMQFRVIVGVPSFVEQEEAIVLPAEYRLCEPWPNPFGENVSIRFELPEANEVRVEVVNLAGRRVRTLVEGTQIPGVHTVMWHGTDNGGVRVASGVYICRLVTEDGGCTTRSLILLREKGGTE